MSARAIRRALVAAVVVTAAAAPAALPARARAAATPNANHSFLTVMTRNLDEGTDFKYIVAAAQGQMTFADAVAATYAEVLASNPCGRAATIADEIATAQPDFVSLQEAALWTGPLPTGCTAAASPTTIDAEAALLARLAADDAQYKVVAQQDEFSSSVISFLLPPGMSFLDRDVLLARVEPAGQLSIANVQTHHFTVQLSLPLSQELSVPIVRGWISADATVRGHEARVVATHLESFNDAVQQAQADEVAADPADTDLPVILAGDLNTGPGADFTAAYHFLTTPLDEEGGGFTDTWSVTRPGDPGFTNSYYTEDPTVPATPSQRIDLVLVRNIDLPSAPKDYLVGGEIPHPSDHAGVVAKVSFR